MAALSPQTTAACALGAAEALASELRIAVSKTSRSNVAHIIRHFLDAKVASHSVAWQACDISSVVFLDFVPLSIEISLTASNEDETIATLKHSKQNDVILMHQFFWQLVDFLRSSGLACVTSTSSESAGLMDDDFDLEDDDMWLKMTCGLSDLNSFRLAEDALWSERVELVQVDMTSRSADVREEALQHLARWTASEPGSHKACAKYLQESQVVTTIFANSSTSLTELYPAAAALKNVVVGDPAEICDSLCVSKLFIVLQSLRMSELPPIVARELAIVVEASKLWIAHRAGDECKKLSGDTIDSNSTRCTDAGTIYDFDDDVSEPDRPRACESHAAARGSVQAQCQSFDDTFGHDDK
jgi:hypothetical protein